MLVEGIKSRPLYGTLEPRPGRLHLVAANDEGALAVLEMVGAAPAGFLARTHIVYVPGGSAGKQAAERHGARLTALGAASYQEVPTDGDAVGVIAAGLADAGMGTQVYVAGTENLIAQVIAAALEAGLDPDATLAEHRGSLERRVQCVHCKAITEHVTTQPATCSGCGLSLLVRDHFSRRIGAFQGVCVDAEEPGTAPPPEPVFA
ncbi:dimethylamine monooxygenase subunit DmmA family protein [soil metagenome]